MNRRKLRRIFAIIGLVGAIGMAVTVTLYFFNMFGELSTLFGSLALAFVAFTLVFWALTYMFRSKDDESSDAPSDPLDDQTQKCEDDVGPGDDEEVGRGEDQTDTEQK